MGLSAEKVPSNRRDGLPDSIALVGIAGMEFCRAPRSILIGIRKVRA
jgi:hypothetical protein